MTFTFGDQNETFSVPIIDDKIVEENETLRVNCTTDDNRVNLISCNTATIDIINDDTYIYFCPSPQTSIRENVGPYVVRLCRIGVLSANHTVELCNTDDSNGLPHDFPSIKSVCNIITFNPNDEVQTSNIIINDDIWGEKELKSFTISIKSNDSAVTFNNTPTSYAVQLQDNDNTFFLASTLNVTVMENSSALNITINRTGEISVAATV
ncbi:hypothetical protein QZH41_010951, partial [Actinostola sp. cb2023]